MSQETDVQDIKRTVHAIQESVSHHGERLAKLEGRQAGYDEVIREMPYVHRRLDERIDGLANELGGIRDGMSAIAVNQERQTEMQESTGEILATHVKQEDSDRRWQLRFLVTGVVSLLGAVGWWVFEHVARGIQ